MPSIKNNNNNDQNDLSAFVELLAHPEASAATLLWNPAVANEELHPVLLKTTQGLFRRVEELAQLYYQTVVVVDNQQQQKQQQLNGPDGNPAAASAILSGLEELYVGDDNGDNDLLDIETLWGQVDLQNNALESLLKQSIRKLTKATTKKAKRQRIQLLEDMVSEDETSSSDDEENDAPPPDEHKIADDDEEEDDDDEDDAQEKDDEDEAARRMRQRMERAMADMEEDEGDDDERVADNESDSNDQDNSKEKDDDLVDPAAEELNNGFFDINEMEAFADEEEEYLPDSAFGNADEEKDSDEEDMRDKRTFHQKQRDGDFDDDKDDDESKEGDDDDDDEDDEDTDPLTRKTKLTRRKKYRADDEIEALYSLYGDNNKKDATSDDEDAINMTAADFFGKPNKKYLHKWKSSQQQDASRQQQERRDSFDEDSWNDYDFEGKRSSSQKKTGWNDDDDEDDDEQQHRSDSDEAEGDDDEKAERGEKEVEDEDERGHGRKNESDEGKQKGDKPNQKGRKDTKGKQKLESQIEELEKELIAEKPWQMKGETTSMARPTNSLLEATPEFEVATKMAPIITVEHTATIEEMIKGRVLKEDWDDVVPRELPDVGWHAKRGELPEVSQEKSKLGLGELYEREYLKKAVGYDVDASEKQSEEDKAKNEMKTLFANLCSKLDALSNYHFAPRPVQDEAEIRPVTQPAIAMEEVLPLHVSDARAVAPEEVYGKKHGRDGVLRADSELEQPDRKRLRSAKKAARRKARQQKQADEKLLSRLEPGLGLNNPYEKRKMREELAFARARGTVTTGQSDTNDYASSGTFFKRLQEKAQESIQDSNKKEAPTDTKDRKRSKSSSYKL